MSLFPTNPVLGWLMFAAAAVIFLTYHLVSRRRQKSRGGETMSAETLPTASAYDAASQTARVTPARSTRYAGLAGGIVLLGGGVFVAVLSFFAPWTIVLALVCLGLGVVILSRLPRLGLYIDGEQARLVGPFLTKTIRRSDIIGINEWPSLLETRVNGRAGVIDLSVFDARGDPHQQGPAFDAQRQALRALSEWTGIPILESR